MLIKDIFMELRSRLRSCNVYITTTVDFKKNCNLKISIQSTGIVLNYYLNDSYDVFLKTRRDSLSSIESLSDCYSEEESDVTEIIPIDEFCRIIPNSMSGLKIDRNNISFRILTEPKNGGNFYNELLTPNVNAINNNKNVNNAKIDIKIGDYVKIICSNCVNTISDNVVKFDRILELPSENMDMSEWFCHNHGNTSNNELVLKQSKYDLLYRLCFIVINNCMLNEKINKFNMKRAVYHCNRCLAWLGLKNNETVKLFNSTIKIIRDGNTDTLFKYNKTELFDYISTNDFIYTIECMIKEFNLGFQYAIMCKLILECTISAEKKHFLLIWVMDKELQVLKNSDEYIPDNVEKIKLISSRLTKILYKVEMSLNDEVESWICDPGVVSTEISKTMFYNGLEHLRNMSMKVPESFRTTNGYTVSYLNV